MVDEELELHYLVKKAVHEKALASQPDMNDVVKRMVSVRDEAIGASEQDLAALYDQLHQQQILASRDFNVKLPNLAKPYFAHLRLQEEDKVKDILLGHQTFIDSESGITIVDWKTAPIAKVYFNYREGESYYEQLPGRIAEGEVVFRRMIAFNKGELVRIASKAGSYFWSSDGTWKGDAHSYSPELKGGAQTATRGIIGTGQSGRGAIEVSSLLDPDQYKLMNSDPEDPLLILGGAGCGKTTVALHRLAKLHADDPKRFAQNKMAVIVPDIGLVMLSKKLLESLGLAKVRVSSFDEFIAHQGRHLLRALPSKLCRATPAKVVYLKRHPVVLDLLDHLVNRRTERFAEQIEKEFSREDPEIRQTWLATQAECLNEKIEKFAAELEIRYSSVNDHKKRRNLLHRLEKLVVSMKKQLLNVDSDRKALFTDEELLVQVIGQSGHQITRTHVEETVKHTLRQYAEEDKSRFKDVDVEARTTIDGRLLDDELDSDEVGGTIDAEDYPIFLMLLEKYYGEIKTDKGGLMQYSHLVLDEAQELAPVELQILGKCLSLDGGVTIAGDAAQQTDPNTSFTTWEFVLSQLDQPTVTAHQLTTNYRSPRPVAEFAHHILGDQAPKEMPKSLREGAPVNVSHYRDEGHAATMLYEALEDLMSAEPKASVAVICKDYDSKLEVFESIKELPEARLIKDGRFSFTPGIDVTEVSMIKGLEFDYVIIPDLDIAHYPDRPQSRRALHVAATRAMFQLWAFGVGVLSPCVPKSYLAEN